MAGMVLFYATAYFNTFYFFQCQMGPGVQALFQHINEPPTKIMLLGGICSTATLPIAECSHFMNLIQVQYIERNREGSVQHARDQRIRTRVSRPCVQQVRVSFGQLAGNRAQMLLNNLLIASRQQRIFYRVLLYNDICIICFELFEQLGALIHYKQSF